MVTKIDLGKCSYNMSTPVEIRDLIVQYLSGTPIFVENSGIYERRRTGSIGRMEITNMQAILHNLNKWEVARLGPLEPLDETPSNFTRIKNPKVSIEFKVSWEGRPKKLSCSQYELIWLKDYTGPTVWKWEVPKVVAKPAYDKLGRELKVNDFISYILYHFDNSGNAAGIYYGKITKIDADGTVWAKNIKLKESDKQAEKVIKDNSLIVSMTKDLMDRLVMARLSF